MSKPMTPGQSSEFWKKYPNIGAWVIRTAARRAEVKAQRRADNDAEIARLNEKLARRSP